MSTKTASKSHNNGAEADLPVVIREATGSDRDALRKLAQRDSARLPAEPLIVAVVGDEVRAAVSVASGDVIADPFHHTAEIVALAELRAAQLGAVGREPLRLIARTTGVASRPVRDAA